MLNGLGLKSTEAGTESMDGQETVRQLFSPDLSRVRGANGCMYDVAELRRVFDQVAPAGDWRGTIRRVVAENQIDVACEAIRFFTATEPRCRPLKGGFVMVEAVGYRNGPAGP